MYVYVYQCLSLVSVPRHGLGGFTHASRIPIRAMYLLFLRFREPACWFLLNITSVQLCYSRTHVQSQVARSGVKGREGKGMDLLNDRSVTFISGFIETDV